jgi:hypothetical protein
VSRAGDVLENPATGERFVFLRTAADVDSEAGSYSQPFAVVFPVATAPFPSRVA